jgi:hypothetical protein
MDWKKPLILVVVVILVLLFLFKLFWEYPFYPPSGGCHFGLADSLNQPVNSNAEVMSALLENGWKLTSGFDANEIREVDFNDRDFPVQFIDDNSIRYWIISAYKTKRVDLVDQNGNLYTFYNCV